MPRYSRSRVLQIRVTPTLDALIQLLTSRIKGFKLAGNLSHSEVVRASIVLAAQEFIEPNDMLRFIGYAQPGDQIRFEKPRGNRQRRKFHGLNTEDEGSANS